MSGFVNPTISQGFYQNHSAGIAKAGSINSTQCQWFYSNNKKGNRHNLTRFSCDRISMDRFGFFWLGLVTFSDAGMFCECLAAGIFATCVFFVVGE